jgi:nicotinamide-nucleotide amidase
MGLQLQKMNDIGADVLALSAKLGVRLSADRRWISVAESCTGGGLAAAITEVAGSSGWFECGFVTYSNAAKSRLLGVPESVFEQFGAVSRACVLAMSAGVLENSTSHYAVAISGVAGPGGGSAEKPVGTVWIAWRFRADSSESGERSDAWTTRFQFDGDRAAVRQQAVVAALNGVIEHAQNQVRQGSQ